jgi:hypothetical protein
MLVWLLQDQKQVRIERLAAALPLPIQQNSRRRHLQRFLTLNTLSVVLLWFPIIEEILTRQTKPGSRLIIALDLLHEWERGVPVTRSYVAQTGHCMAEIEIGRICYGLHRLTASFGSRV